MNTSNTLFAPNNHSIWKIGYREIERERADHLSSIIRHNYSSCVDNIISIEQVDEAEVNSNNFKISSYKNGEVIRYLLRRIPSGRSRQEVERPYDIMQKLSSHGVMTSRVLLSEKKEIAVEGKGEWFILFDFIDGNHYRGILNELVDAGSKLGKLDKELLDLTAQYKNDPSFHLTDIHKQKREFSVRIWEDIFQKTELLSKREEDTFGKDLLKCRDDIMTVVSQYKDESGDILSGFQLVHFDLHPHNLLTDGEKLLAILDFDSVKYLEKMRAVAFAIHRLVRQLIVHTNPTDLHSEVKKAMSAFITAYRSQNTLTEQEIKSIPFFIKHESLSRLTNAMKEYANTGSLLWKNDLQKQMSNIAEAEYFTI